jgi:hypothetical protein
VQFLADGQDTEGGRGISGWLPSGRSGVTLGAQAPELCVNSTPLLLSGQYGRGAQVSLPGWYVPTAAQLPAEEHDTEERVTSVLGSLASLGRPAFTPVAHAPEVCVNTRPWPTNGQTVFVESRGQGPDLSSM